MAEFIFFVDKFIFCVYSKDVYKTLILLYLRVIKRLNLPLRIIDFSVKRYAQSPFIIQPDSNFQLSFKEFGERILKLAFFFSTKGVTQPETIAFSAKNSFEYFEIRAACHKSGIVFLGLPPNLSAEDVGYFLNKTKAKIFFYMQSGAIDLDLLKKNTQVKWFIDLDGVEYKEIFQAKIDDVMKQKGTVPGKRGLSPFGKSPVGIFGDISTFNLSSGTTQKTPKIIQLSNGNWVESLYGIIGNADITSAKKQVFLCAVSFLTSGSTTFLPVILAGVNNIVVNEDAGSQKLAGLVNQYKVTRLYITPSCLLELLEWCRLNNEKLSSLENITIGTERMPASKLKEAVEFFGAIIYVGYGMVEALPPIAMLTPKEYRKTRSPIKLVPERVNRGAFGDDKTETSTFSSVGRVSKGVEIRILEDGRIAVRNKTVSLGYLDNLEENARCFKDGWFYTNDYGFIDEQGYLHILGRKEDILRESPRRIFAQEIEDRVYVLPFVNRCACVARDGKIVVFVSLRGKIDEQDARGEILRCVLLQAQDSACASSRAFAQDKDLSQDEIRIVIKDSLPINYAGKLDKKSLVEN